MPVLDVAAATGSAVAALGFNHPLYAVTVLTVAGPRVRPPSGGDADQVVDLGWIAFGTTLTLGGSTFTYWHPVLWIGFQTAHFAANPSFQDNTGTNLGISADQIRWHISAGSTVAIHVFGNT